MGITEEIDRRRTFAIISHPDAGKTTITEKILYEGRVIREAGEVKGKAGRKAATSDWMKMEQERGISITSSVMQFDYHGLRINLLDTPGHKDFGEDTYRTLVAADSVAMLIDAAKGVEAQTRKLYEVCKLRKVPIFTFANKMDREGKDPLEIIDDVESTLGIRCYPVTWPLGMGERFRGLYHRLEKALYLYTKGEEEPEIIQVRGWEDPEIANYIGQELYDEFLETIELLEIAIGDFTAEQFLAGEVSPMTFGSAKFSWGVDIFMKLFKEHAPGPGAYIAESGEVDPHDKEFSGFIFKVQANMDRKHRDRVAFCRICSGEFQRGMKVKHMRLGRDLRLSYANSFMAQDRDTVESAYAGDILGIIDTGNFRIGDSITNGKKIVYKNMPRFAPEVFGRLNIKDPLKRRQMQKGIQELAEEGSVQTFYDPLIGMQDPILGVVGELQFEVLLHRLNDEYKLDVKLERLGFSVARWPRLKDGTDIQGSLNGGTTMYKDANEQFVVLLQREWDVNWLIKENPDVEFHITGN